MRKFMIVYGECSCLEKRAVETISQTLSDYVSYAIPAVCADCVKEYELSENSIILTGTEKSNKILAELAEKGVYKPCRENEGYSIKITENIFGSDNQMIIIAGADERGALYGAVDFGAYNIPYAENTHCQKKYFRDVFKEDEFPEFESVSHPKTPNRGLWTWGHVIYDYRGYIRNMVRLKMNTLIIWNDYVPINIDDVIDEAHSYGISVYLGFSWGWNEAREDVGRSLDISDAELLEKISNGVVENYKNNYMTHNIDGVYFQSFTETNNTSVNGVVIAKCVVDMVNTTAQKIYELKPDIKLMFGLHANSVSEKLEYIKETDERVMIVWEDCGAFPYTYSAYTIDEFDAAYSLTGKIAALRSKNELFGVVLKGMTSLHWPDFEHQAAPFVMGDFSPEFIKKRTEEKRKNWKYVNAYWLKNMKYAADTIRLINQTNKNATITGLVEDGMFESQIMAPVAIFAELMWDSSQDINEMLTKIMLRKDVE